MKRGLILILVCIWVAAAAADEIPRHSVTSTIKSATVYSDRAMIRRVFEADLPSGFSSLVIPKLPSKIIDQSVRVTGKGTSGATISGVRVEEEYLESAAQEAVRKLQEKKDEIENQIGSLEDRKAVLSSKKKFIESLSENTSESIAQNIAVQRPNISEWAGMVSFVDKSLNEISAELRQIDRKIKELNNQKSVVEREMIDYQQAQYNSEKSVQVDLEMENPGHVSMELSYVVMGANWTPIYDIRASSDNDTISVIFMANVSQNTGEDWDDVQLELSTARPSLGAAPTTLNPWYLNIVEPGNLTPSEDGAFRLRRTTGIAQSTDMKISPDQYSEMKQLTNTQMAIAQVSQQLISTSFSLKQSESIPSNNDPKKVSVKVASAVGKKEYYAIPKTSGYAYLRTKVTNQTNFPLLPGNASVFFDGNFVSTSSIPLIVPSESFDLFLGVDEGIKIKRELIEKFSDLSGVVSKKNRVEYKYQITLENYRDQPRQITVLDQVPVTQIDEIDVKTLEISPEPQYKGDDQQKGILRWVLDLEPRGIKKIDFGYQVKYPSEKTLQGLN